MNWVDTPQWQTNALTVCFLISLKLNGYKIDVQGKVNQETKKVNEKYAQWFLSLLSSEIKDGTITLATKLMWYTETIELIVHV